MSFINEIGLDWWNFTKRTKDGRVTFDQFLLGQQLMQKIHLEKTSAWNRLKQVSPCTPSLWFTSFYIPSMHAHPIPLIHLPWAQKTSEFLLVSHIKQSTTRLLQPFKNKLQNEGHKLCYAQTPQQPKCLSFKTAIGSLDFYLKKHQADV